MIILDTNVISEPWRPNPDGRVLAWLSAQDPSSVCLAAPVVGELTFGCERLVAGRRRDGLRRRINKLVDRFDVLAFDLASARRYGRLLAAARRGGLAVSPIDGQIAAIADSAGAVVATRDVTPFEAMGVSVINPWGGNG